MAALTHKPQALLLQIAATELNRELPRPRARSRALCNSDPPQHLTCVMPPSIAQSSQPLLSSQGVVVEIGSFRDLRTLEVSVRVREKERELRRLERSGKGVQCGGAGGGG
ncbi:hypothetical protein M0R45_033231 [Rubus argutus]|uniref:Uncharacterized protein n=1 Tax=Rubus argutus TaxID=59490 RepID=A0AAW1WJD5_RUBAR